MVTHTIVNPQDEELLRLLSGHKDIEEKNIEWFVKEINSYTPCILEKGNKERRSIDRRLSYLIKEILKVAKRYSKRQQKLVISALRYAAQKHKGVYRKNGKTPYLFHPLEVAALHIKDGIFDFKSIIASILHDVPEDTTETAEECIQELNYIGKTFGFGVKIIVGLVTVPPDSIERKSFISFMKKGADTFFDQDSDEIMGVVVVNPITFIKKAKYWSDMKKEPDLNCRWRVIVLKIEDRIHNMMTLGVMSEEKRKYKIEETRREFPELFTVLEKTIKRLYKKRTLKNKKLLDLSERLQVRLEHEMSKHL
jgi:hypothetical protein